MTSERLAQVRRAMPADVAALVDLRAEMFDAMGVEARDDSWRRAAHEWFETRLDDPDYGIFVVEDDGAVVASAVGAIRDAAPSPWSPSGSDVLINNVCTTSMYRGRGHASSAFDAVLAWARGTGVRRAELMATEDGRSIYERAGFVETSSAAMRAML